MKKSLNLDLLEFHVREAAQELDLLLDAIQYAKERTRRKEWFRLRLFIF